MRPVLTAASLLLAAGQSLCADGPPQAREPRTHVICPDEAGEVFVRAGKYQPFFKRKERRAIAVGALCASAAPITNRQFQSFVREHPEWRRSRVERLFAEANYLADWRDDLEPPVGSGSAPVMFVSWFAASAYCESRGARLPTVAEWERIAGAPPPANLSASAGTQPFAFAMGHRAADLADTPLVLAEIWEWTEDFNSAVVPGRIGSAQDADTSLFCGDGFRAENPSDYAGFLRYSFRSSLRAAFTLQNLGFRCVREVS